MAKRERRLRLSAETGADPRDEACEAAHEGTVGALCEGLVAVERTAKKLDEKCWGPLPTPQRSHTRV